MDPLKSDTSEVGESRYKPDELAAILLDFYTFLTALQYDKADLKVPPASGSPQITPEPCGHCKCTSWVHFKSRLLDFTTCTREKYEQYKDYHEGLEIWSEEGEQMDPSDAAETFFENLKEQYRSLKLIPGRGRITIEAKKAPERKDTITEAELRAQTEEWGTELDI
ncbi:hypothetical protein NCS56_00649100 [Fusarium sp. Ph1]|nr:hypothetical protein NCS56_00649100 [Fusarium sp. Ph1]